MTKLYVELQATPEVQTRDPYDDGWDRGDYSQSYEGCEIRLEGYSPYIATWSRGTEVDFTVIPGQTVYPVIVQYSTGDTFGRNDGRLTLVDVFENIEAAYGLEEAIKKNNSGDGWSFEYAGKEYYAGDWKGYFEYLENVIVESCIVQ